MGENSAQGSFTIESHYAKQPDGYVYYYWRLDGSNSWNVQKTALKEVPYVELQPTHTKLPQSSKEKEGDK